MEKSNLLGIIFIVLIAVNLPAQQFQRSLDPGRLTGGTSIIELPDSSLVISSAIDEDGPFAPAVDLNITRLLPDSTILWSKDFVFEQPINLSVIREWPEEEALLVAISLTNAPSYQVLLKIDLTGNVLWSRRFGQIDDFFGINLGEADVLPLSDGSAILAGGARFIANSDDDNDLYVGKVDAAGNLLWGKNYCFGCLGEFETIFGDIIQTADGGFLISGGLKSTEPGFDTRTRLLLVKIDADGNLEWGQSYFNPLSPLVGEQIGQQVAQLPNGNYLVAGIFDDFAGEIDGLLIQVGQTGEYLSALTANIPDTFYDVDFERMLVLDDNTTVVSGSAVEQTSPSEAVVFNFLAQIQSNGNVDWSYSYFEEISAGFNSEINDLTRLSSGGYGYLANYHLNFDEFYPVLVVTDENGQTGCEVPINLTTNTVPDYVVNPILPQVQDNLEVADFGVSDDPFNLNFAIPELELGPDTAFCNSFALDLDATIELPATYDWSSGQNTPVITVTSPGTYVVTVSVNNTIDCLTLTDSVVIDQVTGPIVSSDTTICQGQSIVFDGETLNTAGTYTATLPGLECDTLLSLVLTVLPATVTAIDTTICAGESLTLGGETYLIPGTYTQTFPTADQCDSVVTVNLSFFPEEIDFIEQVSANCAANTVTLAASVGSTFAWSTGASTPSVEVAAPGSYALTITDDNGCQNQDTLDLAPLVLDLLELEIIQLTDYNGFEVSCAGGNDGAISVLASGGAGPYSYSWSNGDQGNTLNAIGSGSYVVSAADPTGCRGSDTVVLNAPPPLDFDLEVTTPSCFDAQDGAITFVELTGGVSPYGYALNGAGFQTETIFTNLPPNTYEVTVRDANGCEVDLTTEVSSPQELFVNLGPDQSVELGESIRLNAQNNLLMISSISWTVPDSLSCEDCLAPAVTPLQTGFYRVVLTDEAGCIASDEIRIIVVPDRSVYVPNAFSPNGDGVNDSFTLFVGDSVDEVLSLQVYNRWGGLVFESLGTGFNTATGGWDGKVNGALASSGVYVYFAQVRFIDGREDIIKGDVTLVR